MLPCYNIVFDESNSAQLKLSLVSRPAVDSLFLKFNHDQKFEFSVVDEDQHIIFGVALRANYPIYRNDNYLGEYLISFSKETIEKIEAEFLKTRKFNLAHDVDTQSISVLESFIINREKGIAPTSFENIEDGSWLIKCKINDSDLWKQIKAGEFAGFSIEGLFSYSKVELSKQNTHKMTIKALKLKLAKLLLKLGTATAVKDETEYVWEYEGQELVDGTEVFITDENDELVHPEDGEYVIGEETWEVRDGIVRKIEKTEETEETKEEVIREEAEEVEEVKEDVTEEVKEDGNDTLRAEIDAINKRLDEISEVINNFMELTTKISSRLEELESKLSVVANKTPEKLNKTEFKTGKEDNPYSCLRKN